MSGPIWTGIKIVALLFTLFYRPKHKQTIESGGGTGVTAPGELKIQTSRLGGTIPIVYGRRKLAGNLIWYGNFQSHEHYEDVETQEASGGKGGGGAEISTRTEKVFSHYTYSASFAFAVCMGPVEILSIWIGKDPIPNERQPRASITGSEAWRATDWRDLVGNNWEDLGIRIYNGTPEQEADSHLASFVPRAPRYKNVCYVVFENFNLGDQTYIPNFNFEVNSLNQVPALSRSWGVSGLDINIRQLQCAEDKVYACTTVAYQIRVSDLDGNLLLNFGSYGSGDGQFGYPGPTGVKYYEDKIYVTDWGNDRIQVFDAEGNFIKKWYCLKPTCIDVYNDEIYVLREGSPSSIQVYDLDGNLVRGWNSPYLTTFTIANSALYGVTNENPVFKCQTWYLDGTLVREWNVSYVGWVKYYNGYLYVAITYQTVYVYTLLGELIREWTGPFNDNSSFDIYGGEFYFGSYSILGGLGGIKVFTPPFATTPPGIALEILRNRLYGLGWTTDDYDAAEFSITDTYCVNNDMLISIIIDSPISVVDLLLHLCSYHNGYITVSSLGKLAYKQIKTETVSIPVDVATDVIKSDPPVQYSRESWRDVYNKIIVKYVNQDNDYETNSVIANDGAHQITYGEKANELTLEGYGTASRALKAAYAILHRSIYNPRHATFTTGPKKALELIAGGVFALYDSFVGITALPMRIMSTSESKTSEGNIEINATEEMTYVLDVKDPPSSQPWIPPVKGGDPGFVRYPMVAELPPIITGDLNIVIINFSDSIEVSWMGASLYESFDGTSYDMKRTVFGSGLIGVVDSVTPDKVIVTVTDEDVTINSLVNVFSLLVSLNNNLCWVQDSNTYFRFAKATLISAGKWELEGFVWDCFNIPGLKHAIEPGQIISFMREKQEPLAASYSVERRGHTIYFKVASFNKQGHYQSLADVSPISLTFESVGSRPITPQNIEVNGLGSVTKFPAGDLALSWRSCNRLNRGCDYERSDQIQEDTDFIRFTVKVKSGVTTLRTADVTDTSWTYTAAMQAIDGNPSAITFEVVKYCEKNHSFAGSLNITVI